MENVSYVFRHQFGMLTFSYVRDMLVLLLGCMGSYVIYGVTIVCSSLICALESCNLYFANCRAAYKGFGDCIRLLLFLDAHRTRQDKEGLNHVSVSTI
jgi:hypothetical protein